MSNQHKHKLKGVKKMKKVQVIGIAFGFMAMLFLSSSVYAQMGMHNQNRDFNREHFRDGEFHKGDFKGMMLEKLNLSDEQKDAVEKLKLNHQEKMIDLKADLEKKELAMKQLQSIGNYTRDEFINAVKAINAAKNNIAISFANHRMDIYEILTPEQKKTFDDMRQKFDKRKPMMKHMQEKLDK